jgi:parallel beta-helix repeat protein
MDLYLYDNIIEENYSGGGGGISIRDDYVNNLFITATIIDNTIEYNKVYGNGAGILSSSSDVTIQNNTIINNHAGVNKEETMTEYGDGGGLHISGQALIENNLIQSNWAKAIAGQGTGGGVYLNGNDSIVFRHNQVIGNLVVGVLGGRGGGVYVTNDHVLLESNLIQNNSAGGGTDFSGGGGIHISKGDITLYNNIITDNAVSPEVNFGSGITISACNPTLIHNTIANNTGGGGHGVYVTDNTDPGQPAFYNTIIAMQTVGVNVDAGHASNMAFLDGILWYGNTSNTNGNVSTFHVTAGDPLFVDPPSEDYHIGVGSAAIDHGVTSPVIKDYDGEPRFVLSDLGADEYWAPGALKYFFLPLVTK